MKASSESWKTILPVVNWLYKSVDELKIDISKKSGNSRNSHYVWMWHSVLGWTFSRLLRLLWKVNTYFLSDFPGFAQAWKPLFRTHNDIRVFVHENLHKCILRILFKNASMIGSLFGEVWDKRSAVLCSARQFNKRKTYATLYQTRWHVDGISKAKAATAVQTCFQWQVLAPRCEWVRALRTWDHRTLPEPTGGTHQSIPIFKAHKHGDNLG